MTKRSMALFRGNTFPHPMEKVPSTVLMGVQSQLSDGRMSKNDDVIGQSSQDFATLVAQLMPATSAACVAS